jgi:putative redox protein
MGERVIVRQNSQFQTQVLALDPHDPDASEFQPVEAIHHLTPYGMLLAGLGSCTAIVIHTYAQHHGVDVEEVELRIRYDRVFADDCEECESIEEYIEQIEEEILLVGDLTPAERRRLYMVSKHCPIHKMLTRGIEVTSHLEEE